MKQRPQFWIMELIEAAEYASYKFSHNLVEATERMNTQQPDNERPRRLPNRKTCSL